VKLSRNYANFSSLPKTQQEGLGCWGLFIVTLLFLVISFTDGNTSFIYAAIIVALLGTVQFAQWLSLSWLDGVLVLNASCHLPEKPSFCLKSRTTCTSPF
jgi:hypothetical protein